MQKTGATTWLTGLSGAGKTTIAQQTKQELKHRNCLVELLDGDLIRAYLSQGLGFNQADREANLRRIGFVANLLSRNGVIAIVSAISPYRAIRDEMRQTTTNFIEVYVNVSLDLCEQRDVKGLFPKARAGEIKQFTGIDHPYKAPTNLDIICDTATETVQSSVYKIITALERQNYIPALHTHSLSLSGN